MSRGGSHGVSDIISFSEASRSATTLSELQMLLDGAVRKLGFRWFALIHNVDLGHPPPGALMLTTYPRAWRQFL